jgi:transcriptional regulator with XRE-family HTH domain
MDEPSAPARPLFDRIESIRANAGMTKTRVAELTGLPRATIDRWQDQPRPPLPESVIKAADGLGIDRNEALRLAGILDGPSPPAVNTEQAVAELRAQLARISAASAEIERRLAELEGRDRRPRTG